MALCVMFFAKTAKNITLRRAPAHFFRIKQKREKNASGKGRMKSKVKSKIKTLGAIPQTPFFF